MVKDLRRLETYTIARFVRATFGSKYSWFWADMVGEIARLMGYHDRPSKLKKKREVKPTNISKE